MRPDVEVSTPPVTGTRRPEPRSISGAGQVTGRATVYRLFDVGGEIHLDQALARMASSAPERVRPVSGEAQALEISNPPMTCALGTQQVPILGQHLTADLSARVFDFGVVSLRASVNTVQPLSWEEFTRFGRAV